MSINLPIPDRGVVDDQGYDDIVAAIDAARSRGGVYAHCWGGVGRTGSVIGGVLAAGHGGALPSCAPVRARPIGDARRTGSRTR